MHTAPKHILQQLNLAGFEAYFVGGCVRDTLLSRPVHDWDITTSATPEEVMQVFPHTVPTGIQHGTVTVVEDGKNYEVTTFRTDGEYLDSRHPQNVQFVRSLREDLSRRDFTINAMAMDSEGNLTDLFGGQEDLRAKIIRPVGDGETRFREDALRMLRAFRFSAQLDFTIEPKAVNAVKKLHPLCKALSVERVRDEVEKTLLAFPKTVAQMADLGLLMVARMEQGRDLSFLHDTPTRKDVRWAGLFYAYPHLSWQDFRLDKRTGQTACETAHLLGQDYDAIAYKGIFAQYGEDVGFCLADLQHKRPMVEEFIRRGDGIYLRDLAVSGADFPHLQGRELGETLNRLLRHVHAHPQDNRKERLYEIYRQNL
ncbi:MAG: CCA tRNA nucleotidyltransferase [Oscillospiraceae bacterium]|nr:CCA tRNA nucleotidyltransferase [Oscillospiraceae bacterium]